MVKTRIVCERWAISAIRRAVGFEFALASEPAPYPWGWPPVTLDDGEKSGARVVDRVRLNGKGSRF